jgi:hypothetical protein
VFVLFLLEIVFELVGILRDVCAIAFRQVQSFVSKCLFENAASGGIALIVDALLSCWRDEVMRSNPHCRNCPGSDHSRPASIAMPDRLDNDFAVAS